MEHQRISLREMFTAEWARLRALPWKPIFIILSATAIQILARFHTSRAAFRKMFGASLAGNPSGEMYEYCFWLLGDFLLQFPLLLLCIRFILKDFFVNYGMQVGESRSGLKIALIFWACMLPLVWVASADAGFLQGHPGPLAAKTDWRMFALYELCSLVYIIGWEFIWRGYMLFGLKEYLGYYSIFVQMIPFTLLHFGSPELETFGAMLAGVGLGLLAFATRSFWYGAIAHMLVLGTMDVFGALRFRAGNMGTGIRDLIAIFVKNFS